MSAFVRGLAAVALSPALRTVVCFDVAPNSLLGAASTFERMIEAAEGVRVQRIVLGSGDRDEGLWTTLDWSHVDGAIHPTLVAGPLAPTPSGTLTLVVIPDLARLSVGTARAAVMLVDADVAHIERDGMSVAWEPTIAWLAGCATDDVGQISPHLLDRFAMRLRLPEQAHEARLPLIQDMLQNAGTSGDTDLELSPSLVDALKRGAKLGIRGSSEALDTVLSLVPGNGLAGMRRELALARLTSATARLEGATEVTMEHALAAAEVLGIVPAAPGAPAADRPAIDASPDASAADERSPDIDETSTDAERSQTTSPIADADPVTDLPVSALPETAYVAGHATPYPEDYAPVDRELAPLRQPPARAADQRGVGTPIGIHNAPTTCMTWRSPALCSRLRNSRFHAVTRSRWQADCSFQPRIYAVTAVPRRQPKCSSWCWISQPAATGLGRASFARILLGPTLAEPASAWCASGRATQPTNCALRGSLLAICSTHDWRNCSMCPLGVLHRSRMALNSRGRRCATPCITGALTSRERSLSLSLTGAGTFPCRRASPETSAAR